MLWAQDCSACIENLLIEAELLGLGAVWLGVHPLPEREAALRALLGIPEHVVPFAIVPFGWPEERKEPSDRYDAGARPPRALVRRAACADSFCLAVRLAPRGTFATRPVRGGRRPPAWRRRDRPRPTGRYHTAADGAKG